MAVGFPTKANWAAGDVFTASALDDLAGTVNTVQYLKPWNTCLNSNFSVWQRGTSISYAASTAAYNADRWYLNTNANQASTVSRIATGDTTNLPNIQYGLRYQRNAGQTGTGTLALSQSYESINAIPYAGKTVTLSFYARAGANFSASSNQIAAYIITGTGTDQNVAVSYTGQVLSLYGAATLTTTWQRFQYTAALPATLTELAIYFTVTPTGTAGANDYFDITGVQLEQGLIANTYQPNASTFQGELNACMRYYFRNSATSSYATYYLGWAELTTQFSATAQYPVPMRTAPSISSSGTIEVYSQGSAVTLTSAIASGGGATVSSTNALIYATTTGLTQYRPYYSRSSNNTSSYIEFNAEL